MKVSTNWIKSIVESEQTSANLIPKDINQLVEKIGAQLGAVEEVIDVGKKYQGIVIAKVVQCDKHPSADKLSVCQIDVGKAKPVQVVCGAPNVAAGQLVVWIPPGVAVPSTFDKDPLVLEAREIGGVVSNGMIASPKELGISDEHEGILVIEPDTVPVGDDFAKTFGFDDYIIDIENKMFTHRPDCFGMLGIARELAGIQHMVFRSPKWYLGEKTTGNHKTDDKLLSVKNEVPDLVPRFMMQIIKNVEVVPSSVETQSALARVGVRPINNVVDATNYSMLETAQPVHAYDYDKVKKLSGRESAYILVRIARKGEKLALLGGKNVALQGGEVVIATDKQVIGLGGVMGGAETEVDENTSNIILEVGNFDMNATRLTAMHHGLFTDAATRFTKNQSPWQNDRVLAQVVDQIICEAGGMPARTIYDLKGELTPPATVKTNREFINERLGLNLSAREMSKLLENVEFSVRASGNSLTIQAPFWRTDIEIPEDIVEEVGRLYGYEHLPLELPPRDLIPAELDPMLSFNDRLRDILSSAGANEALTYSFVHGSLLENAGQSTKDAYHIRNALSPDLQYYRLSLTPSLLEKVHPNIKAGFDKFGLFEIGKGHVKNLLNEEKLPKELERLSVVIASNRSDAGAPYYTAKKLCDYLLGELRISGVSFEPLEVGEERKTAPYYEPSRGANIKLDGKVIGRIGEFKSSIAQALKLPECCAGFDLHVDELMDAASTVQYKPLNRFPSLDQDLCLRSSTTLTYAELTDFLHAQLGNAAKEHGYDFAIEPLDIFQPSTRPDSGLAQVDPERSKAESKGRRSKDKLHKQTTWRITLWHPERTLTTQEANALLDKIVAKAAKMLKAERV